MYQLYFIIKQYNYLRVVSLPPDQTQSDSTVQRALHPSPSISFPSSHSTKPKLADFPHSSRHVLVIGWYLSPELISSHVLHESSLAKNVE